MLCNWTKLCIALACRACYQIIMLTNFSIRQSIESLWQSLSQSNPELLGDFEDFVAEVADEVHVAQRALE